MSYTIPVRINQNTPAKKFDVVEKTVFHSAGGGTSGGVWTEGDTHPTLILGGSETSGTLRFKNVDGEYFLVALGIDSNEPWSDIRVNLSPSNTGVEEHIRYYGGDLAGVPPQHRVDPARVTSRNGTIKVKYTKTGSDFSVTITIDY